MALEMWRAGDYALLLTDCHMPNMDGFELCRSIRREEADGRRLPIVALTANALKGARDTCKEVGMDDYVSKPVRLDQLREKLNSWLFAAQEAGDSVESTAVEEPLLFDPGAMIQVLGSEDPQLLARFYREFLDSGAAVCDELAAAHRDQVALQNLGELAHRLKSSARTVGALQLGSLGEAIEQAAWQGQAATVDDLMRQLPASVATAREKIQAQVAELEAQTA